ncbi:hypothetical protein Tco_0733865 [Tanacetum coccineum]
MVVQNQSQLGEGSAILTDPHHTPTFIQPSTQPQKTQQPRKPKRKDTQVPQPSDPIENVADEAVHKELGDSLVRVATTASSLEAEQDSDEENYRLVSNVDEEMFDVNVLDGEEVFVAEQEVVANKENDEVNVVEEVVKVINTAKLITDATTVSVATTTTATITTIDDITLAQALMEIKSTKPKEKGVVIQELGESTTTISSQLSSQQSQDKDLTRQEQEELSVEEKATLFQQLLEKRRKHFAAKRVEEKRNKPPTKAQQRKIMCTYLKNMEGYKLQDLKLKGEDLEDLYKLVKAKYESTRPVEDLDLLLWGDLKTMFEPHVEDAVWRNQQAYKVLDWKLYDSYEVHSLRMQHMQIYMLVENETGVSTAQRLQRKYAKCLLLLVHSSTASEY